MSGVGSSTALATCETRQVLLAGMSGGFPGVLPYRLTYRLARLYEWNNLERDIKLNKKKKHLIPRSNKLSLKLVMQYNLWPNLLSKSTLITGYQPRLSLSRKFVVIITDRHEMTVNLHREYTPYGDLREMMMMIKLFTLIVKQQVNQSISQPFVIRRGVCVVRVEH